MEVKGKGGEKKMMKAKGKRKEEENDGGER